MKQVMVYMSEQEYDYMRSFVERNNREHPHDPKLSMSRFMVSCMMLRVAAETPEAKE